MSRDICAYEAAVADYARTGDEFALTDTLRQLGYERDEIDWQLDRPGQRMAQAFA
jgi:hypothetical protein